MNDSQRQLNSIQTRYRASVLIVVIWIVLILASLILVVAHTVRVEAVAAANHLAQVKAEAIAHGAIQYVLAKLSQTDEGTVAYNANPYEAVPVGDGYFWILRPNLSDDRHYDFGLVEEAGKVNLNSESPSELLEMLLKLPNMTAELANSLIDWQDEDQDVSAGGAESEYYLLLREPYQCKNAPLETIEEVLLIKGGSLTLLYGEDTNRNGVLDWNENDGDQSPPSDNSNNRLDGGFFNYVTIHSYETNIDAQGQSRLDLTRPENQGPVQELLETVISTDQAIAVMQSLRNGGLFRGRSNLSLIDVYFLSGMKEKDFSGMMDRLTTDGNSQTVAGRINVNTAPKEVLMCLPGLEESDVDALVQKRNQAGTDLNSTLWVTGVLDAEKARRIGRSITAQSSQYSADIVAVSADGRAFARYYVVVDTAQGTPRVIYKQNLHPLGWPLDPEIRETLQSGQQL